MERTRVITELADLLGALRRDHPVRVGVDGIDCAGKTTLADELVGPLRARGRDVIRVSADGFHHPRAIRYRRGRTSPVGYYADSFDLDAILSCVLLPLGPRGNRKYKSALFAVRDDAPLDPPWREASPDAVLLFDGIFLHRPELLPHWDYTVFVQVGLDTVIQRALERDRTLLGTREDARAIYEQRYIPAQKLYLETHRPDERANAVFRNDDPRDPALVTARSAPATRTRARCPMEPPDHIRDLCRAFTEGHRRVLGDKLHGAYLFGAVAFPETRVTGDIDFHVILTEALTETERSQLYDLHAALARDFPPLGVDMDGYYILLDDAGGETPPKSQMWSGATDEAWALHREHVRAGRCIILHGPDPMSVLPPASWPELEGALLHELQYAADHLGEYPDYCVLNFCRLIFSFTTRDVVISKMAAADWAWRRFPRWRRTIELAKQTYPGQAGHADREFLLSEVKALHEFTCDRIREARKTRPPGEST